MITAIKSILINNLPNVIKYAVYADDTLLLYSGNKSEKLKETINKVIKLLENVLCAKQLNIEYKIFY